MTLHGKIAIVTGSGGLGSGRAIARRLSREGAAVVISDIDEPGGHHTVELIQAEGGRAAFLRADVGLESDVRALIAFAEATFGGLDILINNVSAPYRPAAPLEHWEETIRVDLLGPMWGVLHTINAIRKRGGGASL